MTGILLSVLIGAISGFIAGKIMNKSMGLLICILVGIIGGFLGSGLLYLFKITGPDGIWWQLLVGTIGAVVLLWLVSLIKKK